MSEPPPVPSRAVPGVAPALDAVIARAMSADPAGRYASAGELGRGGVAAAGPAKPAPPMRLGPGSMLGDCLLESVAGKGGMGVVYRATQVKLGRTVAVKVMSRELSDDTGFRSRFERECRLAAAIDHPSVVPIYWAGEAAGVLYVVMRYISGGSLREALASRRPARARSCGRGDRAACRRARRRSFPGPRPSGHQAGQHPDRRGERAGAVGDFGLAKALDDTDVTDGADARHGAIYGPRARPGRDARRGSRRRVLAGVRAVGHARRHRPGGAVDRRRRARGACQGRRRATMLEPAARYASAGELAGGRAACRRHAGPGRGPRAVSAPRGAGRPRARRPERAHGPTGARASSAVRPTPAVERLVHACDRDLRPRAGSDPRRRGSGPVLAVRTR